MALLLGPAVAVKLLTVTGLELLPEAAEGSAAGIVAAGALDDNEREFRLRSLADWFVVEENLRPATPFLGTSKVSRLIRRRLLGSFLLCYNKKKISLNKLFIVNND